MDTERIKKVIKQVINRSIGSDNKEQLKELSDWLLQLLKPTLDGLAGEIVTSIIETFVNGLKNRYDFYDPQHVLKQLRLLNKHPIIDVGLDRIIRDENKLKDLKRFAEDGNALHAWLRIQLALVILSQYDEILGKCDSEDFKLSSNPTILDLAVKLSHSGQALELAKTIRMLNEAVKSKPSLLTPEGLDYLKIISEV